MNKAELIDAIAGEAKISKAEAHQALTGIIEATSKALRKGDRVGFGSFSVTKRAARTGRSPQIGKAIKIAAKKVVKFKAGAELASNVMSRIFFCLLTVLLLSSNIYAYRYVRTINGGGPNGYHSTYYFRNEFKTIIKCSGRGNNSCPTLTFQPFVNNLFDQAYGLIAKGQLKGTFTATDTATGIIYTVSWKAKSVTKSKVTIISGKK